MYPTLRDAALRAAPQGEAGGKSQMEKFTKVTGVAAPLMRQNVDTDLVIRVGRLVNNTGRQGLGPYCFEQIRFKPDGSENPDCVFNQEPYRGAPIILAGEDFGWGGA